MDSEIIVHVGMHKIKTVLMYFEAWPNTPLDASPQIAENFQVDQVLHKDL